MSLFLIGQTKKRHFELEIPPDARVTSLGSWPHVYEDHDLASYGMDDPSYPQAADPSRTVAEARKDAATGPRE